VELDTTGLQMPGLPEQPRPGQIVLRPLERGFGHTLGNTMRRILLSSLRGAAVWAFRADGVLHEHQTIPGVVEDVHQIIRNLKSLVLKMDDSTDEAVIELRASKAGPVTARSIVTHPAVEVVNPDHHILELQDDRDLRIELYVNKGRGFALAEAHVVPRGMPADLVRIDAVYNPVTRANFVVEEQRVGQRTDFDRLVLDVETNGAVDVRSAVQYAARLAIEHLAFLAGGSPEWRGDRAWGDDGGSGRRVPAGRQPVPPRLQELLNRPIEDLTELSVRSRNSLQKENIHTVRDLVQRTEQQMLGIDNFGKKSLQEIADFLAGHGLRFGQDLEESDDGSLWWVVRDAEDGAAEIGNTDDAAGNGSDTAKEQGS
jgi:DNA-directed RNA polymerase subunit alpha